LSALAQTGFLDVTAQNIWGKTLERIRLEGKSYALGWLGRMRALSFSADTLVLSVPDRFFRDWVDDHYRGLIEETLTQLSGATVKIAYELVEETRVTERFSQPTQTVNPPPPRPHRLNERFTFSSYVVADSNQLPAAAAAAVAESPGRCYNPLFIYGGTGLGKTHLLHAVGNKIYEKNPERIIYLSSEEFTNEFVESVRDHKMPEFRRKFREECDVLLIDDIQFLGKKEETQKEFFYTFNTLHERSKAIVLTSDTGPVEIPGLEERLRSRFTMGLITDIQEPNFETRVAILKKKGEAEGFFLPDRVCQFIARHIQRNVRELEGALIKISAMHSLTGQEITEDFAAQVLKDILPTDRPVDIEQIQREVARFFKLSVDDLRHGRRTRHFAHARQMAMYLCRKFTKSSFPEIASHFNKDHSTVISSVRKVETQREQESAVKRELAELEAKLGVS